MSDSWYVSDDGSGLCIRMNSEEEGRGDRTLCEFPYDWPEDVERAKQIVREHEAHDGLVAAARKVIEWFDRESDHAVSFDARMALCDEAESMCRAALAKASI